MSNVNPDHPDTPSGPPFPQASPPPPPTATAPPIPPQMPQPAMGPPLGQPMGQPGYGYGYQPAMTNPFDSRGTTVLIIAIVGFVFCQLAGPVAWVMGNTVMKEAQAAGWPEPTTNKIGRIMGIVGTVLLVAVVVLVIILLGVGAFSAKS